MTDIQILTVAIAITFPCLGIIGTIAAVLYSNKRMDDFRTDITQRFNDFDNGNKLRLDDLKAHLDGKIDTAFEHLTVLLKLHEAEHHKN